MICDRSARRSPAKSILRRIFFRARQASARTGGDSCGYCSELLEPRRMLAAGGPVVVSIPDSALDSAVRAALNKPTGDLTTDDMATLTDLEDESDTISNLEGLEYAINLDTLDLYDNYVTDLTPLQGLTSLTILDVGYNIVSDITPLSGLTNLQYLGISVNYVTDLSPLSGMSNLTILDAGSNSISDVSPLAGLTGLQQLGLYDNNITDISPLASLTSLDTLFLDSNSISDASPLASLTSLTDLSLADNQVSDVSALSGLTGLVSLNLGLNSISDVSPLAGLTNLTDLEVYQNLITDITPLASLTNMGKLFLDGNQISDLSPVSNMLALTDLEAFDNVITDVSPLQGLTALKTLYLDNNRIQDASPLFGLASINDLDLSDNYLGINSESQVVAYFDALQSAGASVVYVPQDLMPGDAQVPGNTAGNHFTVSVSNGQIQIFQGSELFQPSYVGQLAETTSLNINGGAGDDTLDFNGPLDIPVHFLGQDGNDTLNVNSGVFNAASDLGSESAHLSVNVAADATIAMNSTQHLAALNVLGTATVAAGHDKPLVLDSLTISDTGKLDTADNDLIVNYAGESPVAAIQGYVKAAISSSNASGLFASLGSDTTFSQSARVLAVFDNHDAHFAKLGGVDLSPDYNQVLVKYTYLGDANADGKVDPTDYAVVDGKIGLGDSWITGDLNFDGKVDPSDYAQIDGNQGAGQGGAGGPQLSVMASAAAAEAPAGGDAAAGAPALALPLPGAAASPFSTAPIDGDRDLLDLLA